jgi:GNAT superfamily N-acetyltransferase
MKEMHDFGGIAINDLTVEKAGKDDIGIVLDLLKEAALWLKDENIDYWQNWIDPAGHFVDWIRRGFTEEQFYFVKYGEEIIATFRLQWDDEMFWGKRNDASGYLHSFTTSRKLKGQEIGTLVLEWIEDLCRKNRKDFLRLDCGAAISGLCRYYEKHGFKNVGEVTIMNEDLILYEKRL